MAKKSNYCDLPAEFSNYKDSKVVIVPVPYDGTSTWVKGADKGPEAILEASANMELYDIETDSEVYRQGIYTDKPVTEGRSPEKMSAAVEKRIKEHLDAGKFTVLLGGEHSVSIGCIAAYAEKYKGLSVIQFDAHGDTREEYHGTKHNHACIMARAREVVPIVQVGIRSMDISERELMDKSRVFFAEDIYDNKEWVKKAVGKLTEKVYVTIDLDVFDQAVMSSTGTPEPGGLGWYDVLGALKEICRTKEVVGFDVVELCPKKDNKAPNFLAAKLIYKILSYKYEMGK